MDAIKELTQINFVYVFISVFVILIGIKAGVTVIEWIINKLGLETKWMRKRREEQELLVKTSKEIENLKKQRERDVEESNAHDEEIKKELSAFMTEIKEAISETQNEMKQFANSRVNDRQQSLDIQKELTNSIKNIVEYNSNTDKQMENLMIAQKEILADKINEKYKYYISIKGIPEDEVDEFTSLHSAYKGVGGNHNGDAKYEYCMNHLSVIPVETKLITKD